MPEVVTRTSFIEFSTRNGNSPLDDSRFTSTPEPGSVTNQSPASSAGNDVWSCSICTPGTAAWIAGINRSMARKRPDSLLHLLNHRCQLGGHRLDRLAA